MYSIGIIPCLFSVHRKWQHFPPIFTKFCTVYALWKSVQKINRLAIAQYEMFILVPHAECYSVPLNLCDYLRVLLLIVYRKFGHLFDYIENVSLAEVSYQTVEGHVWHGCIYVSDTTITIQTIPRDMPYHCVINTSSKKRQVTQNSGTEQWHRIVAQNKQCLCKLWVAIYILLLGILWHNHIEYRTDFGEGNLHRMYPHFSHRLVPQNYSNTV